MGVRTAGIVLIFRGASMSRTPRTDLCRGELSPQNSRLHIVAYFLLISAGYTQNRYTVISTKKQTKEAAMGNLEALGNLS